MDDVDISDFEDEEIIETQDDVYVPYTETLRNSETVWQPQKDNSAWLTSLPQAIQDGLNTAGQGVQKLTDTVDTGVVVPEKLSLLRLFEFHEKCIIKEESVDKPTESTKKRWCSVPDTETLRRSDWLLPKNNPTLFDSLQTSSETSDGLNTAGNGIKKSDGFSPCLDNIGDERSDENTEKPQIVWSTDTVDNGVFVPEKVSVKQRVNFHENCIIKEVPAEMPTGHEYSVRPVKDPVEIPTEHEHSVKPVKDPVVTESSGLSNCQRLNTPPRTMSVRENRKPKKSQYIPLVESGEMRSQGHTRHVEDLNTKPSGKMASSDQQTGHPNMVDNVRYQNGVTSNAVKNDDRSSDQLKSISTGEMYKTNYSAFLKYSEQRRPDYRIEEEIKVPCYSKTNDSYSPAVDNNRQQRQPYVLDGQMQYSYWPRETYSEKQRQPNGIEEMRIDSYQPWGNFQQKSSEQIEGYGYSEQTSGYQSITYPHTTAYSTVSSQPKTWTKKETSLELNTASYDRKEVKGPKKSKGLQRSATMREKSGVRAFERTIQGETRGYGFSHGSMQMYPPTPNTRMQVPKNSIGVWRFGEDNFFTTVPKVWTVSDCIRHVQNKIGSYGNGELDLWIKNRCIMLNKGKSLSDYPGLKSLYVIRRPRSRDPHPCHQTPRRDDTDPFSDDTCVAMPCGHAISPENLYEYAWSRIQNGGIEVTCPAVPDAKRPSEQCSKIWDFTSVSKLACLSNDENCLFCCQLFSNFVEAQPNIHLCPVCNEAIYSDCATVFKCFNCEKSGTSFSFCVHCHRPIYGRECFNDECQESVPRLKTLLRNCPTRTLVNVPNCPSVRACPKCNCVIEYDEEDSCKHMTCPRNSCKTKFCFICLKVKTDKYYWPCGGAFEPCSPSPRQIM